MNSRRNDHRQCSVRVIARIALVLTLAAVSSANAALADEPAVDPSQIPYYDKTSDGTKEGIATYWAAKSPKALAINPAGGIYWWASAAYPAEAQRRALENCELSYKSPCVLAALDNVIQKADPTVKLVSAFAGLGEELDPAKVPFLSDAARKRLAASYLQERKNGLQFMALALHPRSGWYLKVDPTFKSQAEANDAALKACVSFPPPDRYWYRGLCLLFAEGSHIVASFPQAVTFASAAMLRAAENSRGSLGTLVAAQPAAEANAPAPSKSLAQPVSPDRVRFVHTGGNDCPPCIIWRANELPKLQKSPAFQAINFSYVVKTITSPFPPSEAFLPAELKSLKAKLEEASAGRAGSPQQLLIVDGEVYDYWVGDLDAKEILARVAAITAGTAYPGKRCIRAEPSRGPLICARYAESN